MGKQRWPVVLLCWSLGLLALVACEPRTAPQISPSPPRVQTKPSVATPTSRPSPTPSWNLWGQVVPFRPVPLQVPSLGRLQKLAETRLGAEVFDLAWSDARTLLVLSVQGVIALPLEEQNPRILLETPENTVYGVLQPDGQGAAVFDGIGEVFVTQAFPQGWRRLSQEPMYVPLTDITFSPDGRLVAAGLAAFEGAEIWIWDAPSSRLTGRISGSDFDIFHLAFSPDGGYLWVAGYGELLLYGAATGMRAARIPTEEAQVISDMTVAPEQGLLALAGAWIDEADRFEIGVRDAQTGDLRSSFRASEEIRTLTFVPGEGIVAGTVGGNLLAWHWPQARNVFQTRAGNAPITALRLSPDGRLLAVGMEDGIVQLWGIGP